MKENMKKKYYSAAEVANQLGISRVAVFKKIQKGVLRATKVGRNYIIEAGELRRYQGVGGADIDPKTRRVVDTAVEKTVREYGETLKLLGNA